MSEYTNVEHPFLEKLREIKWQVIDKGNGGIPQDPAESMRTSFNEIVLKEEFYKKLKELNDWITDEQKAYCYRKITEIDKPFIDANHEIHNMLLEGIHLPTKNEVTGEDNPTAKIINFDNYKKNSFIAINQFRVDTNNTKPFIIPDIVCFVNGLPLVVIECKDEDVSEPMSEAYDQIKRYANQRVEDDPFSEGIEEGCSASSPVAWRLVAAPSPPISISTSIGRTSFPKNTPKVSISTLRNDRKFSSKACSIMRF